MKYCFRCGMELVDDATFCSRCGERQTAEPKQEKKPNKGIVTANKVLLIVLCASLCLVLLFAIICSVFSVFWLEDIKDMLDVSQDQYGAFIGFVYWVLATFWILYLWLGALPLAWTVPMTVHYFKKVKAGQPVTLAFKICMLIFVHTLVGIFMLCFEPNADDAKKQ